MTTRLSFEQGRRLKTDFKLLVAELGTQAEAAEFTRVSQSQISDYKNINMPESFVAADVLADLLMATGSDRVLRILADIAGFVLIKLPGETGSSRVLEASGRSAEKMGALMMDLGQALTDGKLSGPEKQSIHERIRVLQVGLADLNAAVEADNSEGGE